MGLRLLLILLPLVAAWIIFQRRLLGAVILMGTFSLVTSGTYFLLHAPDVAIAEAALGVSLVTFIYILAIRKRGKLTVVADEARPFLYRVGEVIEGIDYEILAGLAEELGLELRVVFVQRGEILDWLRRGEADIAAGGFIPSAKEQEVQQVHLSPGYILTKLVKLVKAGGEKEGIQGRIVGVLAGSKEEETISGEGGIYKRYQHFAEMVADLERGAIGACLTDLARFKSLYFQRTKLELSPVEEKERCSFRFGVAGDEKEVYTALIHHLAELEREGQKDRILRRYL